MLLMGTPAPQDDVTVAPPAGCGAASSDWVCRWAAALAPGAQVLDLACGSGRHVRWLAARGLRVTAVDRDAAALAPLRALPGVEAIEADLETDGPWPLAGRRFDAVVVTHYLWRDRLPQLLDGLAPGGLLIYETFNVEQARIGKPSNPKFLLRHGELLQVCADLQVTAYEDGPVVDAQGRVARHVQRIAACKAGPAWHGLAIGAGPAVFLSAAAPGQAL